MQTRAHANALKLALGLAQQAGFFGRIGAQHRCR